MRAAFETELRTLELLSALTPDQSARKERLCIWIEELREFEAALDLVESDGFATTKLRAHAISDGLGSMTLRWLSRLLDQIRTEQLTVWRERATAPGLPVGLTEWISAAVDRLVHQCSELMPTPPPTETPDELLTPTALADLFKGQAGQMVENCLALICSDWQAQATLAAIQPLKDEAKAIDAEIKSLPESIESVVRINGLRSEVRKIKKAIRDLTLLLNRLASDIRAWRCPEAEQWSAWLGTQPLYDKISSLDGRRMPPATVAEFVAQECQYHPDANDGVRVNIAPLQKAGVLARDVLPTKDIEKAIADRADWRADERRWVRQGILPRPGWWPPKNSVESEPSK
jgi:hypothetical protein